MQKIKDVLRMHLLGGVSSCPATGAGRGLREVRGGRLFTASEGREFERLAAAARYGVRASTELSAVWV